MWWNGLKEDVIRIEHKSRCGNKVDLLILNKRSFLFFERDFLDGRIFFSTL